MPYVLIWTGWGLGTVALGVLGYLLRTTIGSTYSGVVGFIIAAILNLLFVKLVENMEITRDGRTMTRAQESTLFFMPLHYWTYIFVLFAIVEFARVALR